MIWRGGGQRCAEKGEGMMLVLSGELIVGSKRRRLPRGSYGFPRCLGGAKTGHGGKTKIISKMFLWISKMFVAWTVKGVLRVCVFFSGPESEKKRFYLHFYSVFVFATQNHKLAIKA